MKRELSLAFKCRLGHLKIDLNKNVRYNNKVILKMIVVVVVVIIIMNGKIVHYYVIITIIMHRNIQYLRIV